MRTYGRTVPDENGNRVWVALDTDNGTPVDLIWFATLAQTLRLQLGESPFYANYGLPGYQSVQTQVPPDFYVARTQQQFSQYFASLIVYRAPNQQSNPKQPYTVVYNVQALCHNGTVLNAAVPLAT